MISGEKGFTLIEMMIVIVIIAIFSATAVFAYKKHLPDRRLAQAARDLYMNLEWARTQAVLTMQDICVEFDQEKNIYEIHIPENTDTGTPEVVLKSVELSGYEFGTCYGNGRATTTFTGDPFDGDFIKYGNGSNTFTFQSNGISTPIGRVYLTNQDHILCYAVGTPSYAGIVRLDKTASESW